MGNPAKVAALYRMAEAQVGSVLAGRWRLERLIGVGGMAAVYEASSGEGERLAAKVLHRHLAADEDLCARLRREARLLRRIHHPGAIDLHVVGEAADGRVFLIMELLRGESLDARLKRSGPLPWPEVAALGQEVLDVLSACHDVGIVHRDIKPANLFATNSGAIKVLDFGIGTALGPDAMSTHTALGTVMGTPAFMSPEQARGRWTEVDPRSDIWSLGATLFTLGTGEYVHEGSNPSELLGLTMTVPARSVRSVDPNTPVALANALARALEYEPERRWRTTREMQRALASMDSPSTLAPTSARPIAGKVSQPVRRRSYWLLGGVILVASGAVSTAIAVVSTAGRAEANKTLGAAPVREASLAVPSKVEPSTSAREAPLNVTEPDVAPVDAIASASVPGGAVDATRHSADRVARATRGWVPPRPPTEGRGTMRPAQSGAPVTEKPAPVNPLDLRR